MAKSKLAVTLENVSDGECTYVVLGADKGGGGHWGMSSWAYEALQNMLRVAGGITNIRKLDEDDVGYDERLSKKAIKFVCIPHPKADLDIEINGLYGNVTWDFTEEKKQSLKLDN